MCEKWFRRIPVLDCRGRPHAFAAHFFCLTYLPQQFPSLLQQLLVLHHHRIDLLLLLTATKGGGKTKKYIKTGELQRITVEKHDIYLELKGVYVCGGGGCNTFCERLEASARSFSSFWMVESLWAVALRKSCLAWCSLLLCWICFSLYFLVHRSGGKKKENVKSVCDFSGHSELGVYFIMLILAACMSDLTLASSCRRTCCSSSCSRSQSCWLDTSSCRSLWFDFWLFFSLRAHSE